MKAIKGIFLAVAVMLLLGATIGAECIPVGEENKYGANNGGGDGDCPNPNCPNQS